MLTPSLPGPEKEEERKREREELAVHMLIEAQRGAQIVSSVLRRSIKSKNLKARRFSLSFHQVRKKIVGHPLPQKSAKLG